jgi:hypothetical protein
MKITGKKAQVMILTILTLGATILGATTIAGLMMLYQLRQSRDDIVSNQAIYAAESGLECGLYQYFNNGDISNCNSLTFSNGANVSVSLVPGNSGNATSIVSVGTAGENVKRALSIVPLTRSTTLQIP